MENWFEESEYEINGQVYSVPKLAQWASNNLKVVQLPLSEIKSKYIWADKLFIDVPDDDEWAVRSMRSDFKFPILMLQHPNGKMEIVDGNHRVWKAWRTKMPAIPAYVLDSQTLPQELMGLETGAKPV